MERRKFFKSNEFKASLWGVPRGGEQAQTGEQHDLVLSNEIKETESEREKEVGIQFTIPNIASHPMVNSSA